ncbi:rhomboid family intramembrane serine protease [Uliginosibacterium sp. H3]|uniref:Rhomboid family intramembrane serine protease n=1 Tax=Uliginosibacterium silvisoli TaxID=3114758 RepID=A0ABU6K9E1_9RHOO|nr:rhomboid family intramembrane serine protease [Uliginosibacterium sp. H3]
MDEDEFIERLHTRIERIWLTYALIATCAVVFLIELWQSRSWWTVRSDVLLSMGASFGPKVQSGETWRLLSAVFLHGNPLHLALNMLALWQIGHFIERIYGRSGALLLFVACGLMGSLASIWWRTQGLSVGASGAIFGLYGALLVWLIRRRHDVPMGILKKLRSGTLGFIGYSLFAGIALPGIDNAAHIGGLLGGMLLSLGMAAPFDRSPASQWRRRSTWLALLATAACATALWRTTPQVAVAWQQHVEFAEVARNFAQHDAQLEQQVQALLEQVRQRQIASVAAGRELDEVLLPAWQMQINRLASIPTGDADRPRHQALLNYAGLHGSSLQLLARGLMTGQPGWLQLAHQRQLEAQAALLGTRERSAR